MNVIIKGMNMPKSCIDCKLTYYDDRLGETCIFTDICCLNLGRQDNCPLLALPEKHGRLIDADAHIKSLKDCFCEPCQKKPDHCINCGIDMYIRIVENEPTIMNAEG